MNSTIFLFNTKATVIIYRFYLVLASTTEDLANRRYLLLFFKPIKCCTVSKCVRKLPIILLNFILLSQKKKSKSAFEYCMDQIKKLQKLSAEESELKSLFLELEAQVEDFMCSLLDQVSKFLL